MATKLGEVTSLSMDTEGLRVRGRLSTSNPYVTPNVTAMKVTAIGETPLKNDLESVSDIKTISTSTLSTSTNCVVGNYSIQINSNSTDYKLNENQEFDAKKLPIIQL